jgi:predicted DNA-binding ArsR family transcriptional regulator
MNLRQQLLAKRCDKLPPGWMTLEEMGQKEGYSGATAFRSIANQALDAGLIETKKFRVVWGDLVRARPHYRYTKAANSKT